MILISRVCFLLGFPFGIKRPLSLDFFRYIFIIPHCLAKGGAFHPIMKPNIVTEFKKRLAKSPKISFVFVQSYKVLRDRKKVLIISFKKCLTQRGINFSEMA